MNNLFDAPGRLWSERQVLSSWQNIPYRLGQYRRQLWRPQLLNVDAYRRAAAPQHRLWLGLFATSAVVDALAGGALLVPLLLMFNWSPAAITGLLVIPLLAGIFQPGLPWALERTHGNLAGIARLLTALAAARGGAMMLLAALLWLGAPGWLVLPVALLSVVCLGISVLARRIVTSWASIALPPTTRRRLLPPISAMATVLAGLTLLAISALLFLTPTAGDPLLLLIIFSLAAGLGLREIQLVKRLPAVGRVRVPPMGQLRATTTPELSSFIKTVWSNGLGAGLFPIIALYALDVLDAPAAAATLLGAVALLAAVAGAAIGGSALARGSSRRVWQWSLLGRAFGALMMPLALPGQPWSFGLLLAGTILISATVTAGSLALNERLFRMASGPEGMGQFGRVNAGSDLSLASGQLVSAGLLFLMPLYPLYAALFVSSGLLRLAAWRLGR